MRTIIRNNYDPHLGDYHERIIQDEAREKTWLFDCDGVYLDITAGRGDVKVVNELGDSETNATSQKLVTDELAKKQDTLTAGANITIEGNVISAAGKEYSAGYGLVLNDTEFAADTSVLATKTDVAGKQDALTTGQLAAVNSGIDSTKVGQIATNAGNITTINGKIPAQASSSNQLADKSFVNSTVQTASANFRGNWATWNDAPTDANDYPVDADGNKTPTKNDYMVVQDASGFPTSPDPALAGTWRFKYSGTWATDGKNGWHPEYQVNETPLTSDQLAALNSGITAEAVTKLGGIEAGAEVNDIDSISVNGTAVTPDANKNVALTIPDGIRTLTTEDYDYHYSGSTDDGVALWRLSSGSYKIASGTKVYADASFSGGAAVPTTAENFLNVYVSASNKVIMVFGDVTGYLGARVAVPSTGEAVTSLGTSAANNILIGRSCVDNLTSWNLSYSPLSAKQGYVLNTKIVGTTETLTIADTDWSALSSSDPYTYSATASVTATIGANSTVELINDQAVLFANHGFAIASISGQSVTIYSIGAPSASVNLKINVKGA